jgi:hypothetical protein
MKRSEYITKRYISGERKKGTKKVKRGEKNNNKK